ncbi:neuronal acetylcholine receptor subunit alpha-2-like [Haliotis cracherodii]|uniref:neuronal acetylcholine receptor subunit alpha-2-like n=1 Tax=Haliotis cracherodii TaxID=6455 RepID=UPI0039E96AAF
METAVWMILFIHIVPGHFTSKTPIDIVFDYCKSRHPLQSPVYEGAVLNVSVNINVLHLENLDETKQALTSSAWFYFVWNLKGLTWNETEFQNISRVMVPADMLWLPDLMLLNAIDKFGHLSEDSFPPHVWSNGTVEWYATKRHVTSCKVDVTRFPFDQQHCSFRLAQWVSFSSEVNYTFNDPPITFQAYEENGEWEIRKSSVQKDYIYEGKYQVFIFELVLVRRREYYILAVVVPMSILSGLNLMVFHVPPESGEKMSLCVSVLLAYAVYLTSINSLLPSVSDHVALFSVYLNCMFVLKALTVVASVFVLRLYSASPNSAVRQRLSRYYSSAFNLPNQAHVPLSKSASQDLQMSHQDKDAAPVYEKRWPCVVQRIDHLFFVVFLLIVLASSSGFFCAMLVT